MWCQTYLDVYLRRQWEAPLRVFADQYSRELAKNGRPPTARRLAVLAAPAASVWFGGELATVCSAIGVKALPPQERVKLMPDDRFSFVSHVFEALGGEPDQPEDSWKRREIYQRNWDYRRLAGDSLRYMQLEECTGMPPTATEFHAERYRWLDNEESRWDNYVRAIKVALAAPPVPAPPPLTPTGAPARMVPIDETRQSLKLDGAAHSSPREELQRSLWQRIGRRRKD